MGYLNIAPSPVANFDMTPHSGTILNPLINFTDQSVGAAQWLWNFGDIMNSGSIIKHPSYTYSDIGSYIVSLFVTNSEGCTDSVSHTIVIKSGFAIYIPDAFTPNGDKLNDFFAPAGSELDVPGNFEMSIIDRWGEEVYHTTDIAKPWNGNFKNESEILQQDVYVYKIGVKDASGKLHHYMGHVTLIK